MDVLWLAPSTLIAAGYLLAYAMLRFIMTWVVDICGISDAVLRRRFWLIPVKDLLTSCNFVVWLAGFASNRVTRSDPEYAVNDGKGQLVKALISMARVRFGLGRTRG